MSYHDQLSRWDDSFERDQRADKEDFKLREMEYELRDEEETYRRVMTGPFYIMCDDKIIKDKSGSPYVFHTKDAATKAARTMMQKPWNADKKFYLTREQNNEINS